MLEGRAGLELIESRYLADPKAADGDVRGVLKALRFYHDFGHDIPGERIAAAEVRVLARPEFSAEAITDLARWKDWGLVKQVAALYELKEYSDPFIRRAIVGYLKTCPEPTAAAALDHLRQFDPTGIAGSREISMVISAWLRRYEMTQADCSTRAGGVKPPGSLVPRLCLGTHRLHLAPPVRVHRQLDASTKRATSASRRSV